MSTYYIDFYEEQLDSGKDWEDTDDIVAKMLYTLYLVGVVPYRTECMMSSLHTSYLNYMLTRRDLETFREDIEFRKDQIQECIEEDLCQKPTNN